MTRVATRASVAKEALTKVATRAKMLARAATRVVSVRTWAKEEIRDLARRTRVETRVETRAREVTRVGEERTKVDGARVASLIELRALCFRLIFRWLVYFNSPRMLFGTASCKASSETASLQHELGLCQAMPRRRVLYRLWVG